MSMRDYGVDDYGLVLNTNHLQILASRVLEDYSDEEWEIDKWGVIDAFADKVGVEYIGDFFGEAFAITDSGENDWSNSDVYSGDTIYYVPVSEYPNLFKQAYNNIGELSLEFKKKIGRYLPETFDYRNNIRHIVGTYFG